MKQLFLRLWLVAVGLFVAAMVVSQLIFWLLWSDDEFAYLNRLVAGGHQLAATWVEESPQREQTLADLEALFGFEVVVVDRSALTTEIRDQLDAGMVPAWVIRDTEEYWYTPLGARDSSAPEFLRIGPHDAFPLPDLQPRLFLLLAGAVLFALAFWWILRPLHRSQRALTDTAEQIAAGSLEARVPAADMAAAPAMATAFNHMAERVQQLIDHQREILQVASHELRTPIARLRIGVHMLATAEDDREARAEALDADLEELNLLVEELLTYARLDAERSRDVAAPIDVRAAVARVLARQQVLTPGVTLERGPGLAEGARSSFTIAVVPRLFERVLDNLVGNARRYAQDRIVVDARDAGDRVEVTVEDDGPGIAPEQRERVLLPFSRLGDQGGHGMGLAIVDRIVSGHGGQTRIDDAPLGGCRISTSWPTG